jgi:hypothetical protein
MVKVSRQPHSGRSRLLTSNTESKTRPNTGQGRYHRIWSRSASFVGDLKEKEASGWGASLGAS